MKGPPGVHVIDAPFWNFALQVWVIAGERTVLIDTGIDTTPQDYILPYLSTNSISSLDEVVLSHAHMDHMGGLGHLKKAYPTIDVGVSPVDKGWVENHQKHWNEMYLAYPGEWDPSSTYKNTVLDACGDEVVVTNVYVDGEIVTVGKGLDLTVVAAPAHSPGHVMFYIEREGLLFAGDVIQGRGTFVTNGPATFPYYSDPVLYETTLRKIEEIDPRVTLTSHGGSLGRDELKKTLDDCRAFHREFHSNLLRILTHSKEPLPLKHIARQLHETHYSEYENEFQLHATSYAYLQRMATEGDIVNVISEGRRHWTSR